MIILGLLFLRWKQKQKTENRSRTKRGKWPGSSEPNFIHISFLPHKTRLDLVNLHHDLLSITLKGSQLIEQYVFASRLTQNIRLDVYRRYSLLYWTPCSSAERSTCSCQVSLVDVNSSHYFMLCAFTICQQISHFRGQNEPVM